MNRRKRTRCQDIDARARRNARRQAGPLLHLALELDVATDDGTVRKETVNLNPLTVTQTRALLQALEAEMADGGASTVEIRGQQVSARSADDLGALEEMCRADHAARTAYAALVQHGAVIEQRYATNKKAVKVVPNPAAAVWAQADGALRRWYTFFGLAPEAETAEPDKPWPEWFLRLDTGDEDIHKGDLMGAPQSAMLNYYGEARIKAAKRMLAPPEVADQIRIDRGLPPSYRPDD